MYQCLSWTPPANPRHPLSALWISIFFHCSSLNPVCLIFPFPQNSPHSLSAARSRLRKAASTSSRSTRLCCGATLSRWLSRSSERLESVRLSRQMLCSSSPARAVLWGMGGQKVGNLGIHSQAQMLVLAVLDGSQRPNLSIT